MQSGLVPKLLSSEVQYSDQMSDRKIVRPKSSCETPVLEAIMDT